MKESRTKLALKGISSGFISKIISLVLGFASRTIFIYFLGSEYLGVNGLYSNVLSVLSFAELGFGSAMTFALYKPVANNDEDTIIQLLDYFRKVYRIIALVVAIFGLILIPLLPYLVKGAEHITNEELITYYLLFLSNSVISYFVTYKFSYVNALQKTYIVTNVETILNIITILVQIIVIVLFKNFLAYLLVHTALLIASRLGIALYLNKKFPIVHQKPKTKLPKGEKQCILNNVKGLVVHQFSSIAVHSTDNIIISSMISVIVVGYVSNYNLLITSVTSFLTIVFNSFTATLGNIYATETKDFFYSWFNKLNYINFWLYGFCSVAFFVLIPPFITLWIGGDKLIDTASFALIILNAYLMGQCSLFNTARNAVGNFNIDKWWSLAQAVVNLIVSIPCAKYLGLVGVYIGTIASRMVYVIFRPMKTFKLMFDVSAKKYYFKIALYAIITLAATVITYYATLPLLKMGGWGWFVLSCVIVVIIPNLFFLITTFWTKDFKDSKNYIINKIKLSSKWRKKYEK